MSRSALEALINFAYSGHVAIDQQNVQALLIGSSFLQLQKVKDACCSFLQERSVTPHFLSALPARDRADPLSACRLHPKNCLGVRQFAETMMCTTLYDSANDFVHQHFVEVSLAEEFLSLRAEELLELLGCDQLNIKAEEQVSGPRAPWPRPQRPAPPTAAPCPCRCWRRSWPGSITSAPSGSLCCRSCCPGCGCLCAVLSSWPSGCSRTSWCAAATSAGETPAGAAGAAGGPAPHRSLLLLPVRDLLDEAKDFHLMPERRPHLPAFKTRQRCCTSITGLVYAVGGLNSSGLLPVLVPAPVPLLVRHVGAVLSASSVTCVDV